MKKMFTWMLGITLLCSMSTLSAKNYRVQLGTVGAATWSALAAGDTLINLSTAGVGGSAVSLNAWYMDKVLAIPTFAGAPFVKGDRLYLTKGTYTLTGSITLAPGLSIYGGFAGTETLSNERAMSSTAAWDFTNTTIIDGANSYVAFLMGSGVSTIVDGLTIQNCTNSTSGNGAAAKLWGSGTIIQNCIITNCSNSSTATCSAGGVVLTSGSRIKNSYLHHNTSVLAGAIAIYSSYTNTIAVSGCKIENNSSTSTSYGSGGIYFYSTTSGAIVDGCSFSNNTTAGIGGAIGCYISNSTNTSPISITNCTFTSNSAAGNGGAIDFGFSGTFSNDNLILSGCSFNSNNTSVVGTSNNGGGAIKLGRVNFSIDKCTFSQNYTASTGGGAILFTDSVTAGTISNSKFVGNTAGTTTTSGGSAIFAKTHFTASNCLFADNIGSNVIQFYQAGSVASAFQNCTFANNVTSLGASTGVAMLNYTPKYSYVNCILFKTPFGGQVSPTVTNCGFDVALPSGAINSITGLTSAVFNNSASGDYSLASGSVAIDNGVSLATYTVPVTTDILGGARPSGANYDLGAYEFGAVISGVSDVIAPEIKTISVVKNGVVSKVAGSIQVLDFNGRLLKTSIVEAGTLISITSGIYIIKVQTKEGVSVQKVIL